MIEKTKHAYLLSGDSTQNDTFMLRQAIYYSLLSSSGGTQSGSVMTLWHNSTLVLISYPGCVCFSCSQHLSRTGSSYQCIKTDPALFIKISVTLRFYLNILVTISGICLNMYIFSKPYLITIIFYKTI